jgi:hypothetical protein
VSKDGRAGNDQFFNRLEVLKCLLSVFSQTLYCRGQEIKTFQNIFIEFAVNESAPHVGTLFYSLLNVIFSYNPTGSFAYSTTLVTSYSEDLVDIADIFSILVHYKGTNEKVIPFFSKPKVSQHIHGMFEESFSQTRLELFLPRNGCFVEQYH